MLDKLKLVLNLWDPYKIYIFPDDEYVSYAEKINCFINNDKKFTEEALMEFVYKIIPPIDCLNNSNINNYNNEAVVKIEYVRFVKVIVNIILNR